MRMTGMRGVRVRGRPGPGVETDGRETRCRACAWHGRHARHGGCPCRRGGFARDVVWKGGPGMRKVSWVCVAILLGLGLSGCDERAHEGGVAVVKPPVRSGELHAGELHNDVMSAFEQRAPLESIPSMQWDEWLETTLNSMEDVCAARDLPFNREASSRHIVEMVK